MPIKNLVKKEEQNHKLINITKLLRKDNVTYDVEPEVVELATLHAKIWMERWKKENGDTGKDREWKNYMGLIGQKIFELVLQQLEIPYVPNDPILDWRKEKKYDFRVPNIGTIEVKTVEHFQTYTRLIIKCIEWHDSDYAFAVKLLDKTPTQAELWGYGTNKEVHTVFTHTPKGEYPCPKWECYWQYSDKLHPTPEFFNMLKNKTEKLW
jgi:hypothetical protein